MITDPQGTVLALFAAFCRIGACFMLLPGFGTARVPAQIRVFVAIAVSMALLPLMWDAIYTKIVASPHTYLMLVGGEILIGSVLGMIARLIVLSLQFGASSISMLIGLNGTPGVDLFEGTQQTELATVITSFCLLLLFVFDFHHIVIAALTRSYEFMPVGSEFNARMALVTVTDTLSRSFVLALQVASPFIVYGLVFNLAIGMVNKLAPQIPIYFISLPFIVAGGLFLLYFGSRDLLHIFASGFEPIFMGR